MEPITRDRLYENFDSVMEQIDDIVARRDIAQAQEALNQIRTLVESEEHIRLDDGEPNREGTDIPYDHVLHRLLDVIHGEITTASRIEEDEELRMLISRRREIDAIGQCRRCGGGNGGCCGKLQRNGHNCRSQVRHSDSQA